MKLFSYFASCGKRFHKYSLLIGNIIRDFKQNICRKSNIICKTSVFFPDSYCVSCRTMAIILSCTPFTVRVITSPTYFCSYAFPDKGGISVVYLFYYADKLVSKYSLVSHISFCNFVVSVTNSCQRNLN